MKPIARYTLAGSAGLTAALTLKLGGGRHVEL